MTERPEGTAFPRRRHGRRAPAPGGRRPRGPRRPLGPLAAALLLLGAPGSAGAQVGPASPAPPLPDTLTLQSVLERALAVDPAMAAAGAGADAATSALEAARADRLPSVATSADLVRFQEPMVVAPLHGLDLQSPPEFDNTLVQGQVGLEWTAWDGGARGARIRRARAGRSAALAGEAGTRQERIADVAGAYLDVLTAREVGVAHARQREALEAERDRVARFLAEGTAARVELLRAEAALSAARADEEGSRATLRAAESHLARILEVPAPTIHGAGLRDVALDEDSARAPDDLVAGHPALVAARERADAARASVDEARARWMPTVQATGGFQEFGGSSSDFSTEWRTGVRLSWAVFTGGARGAATDRARAEARRAEEEVRVLERSLRTAADEARAAGDEATARAAALTDAVEQFEELTRVEALALREGAGVQSDYLRAESGLLDARAGLAAARRARVRARIALAAALGELEVAWLRGRIRSGETIRGDGTSSEERE
ncbi:MAG: TolC family protein [Gemmatimonadota bacterium]